jgi:3-methyladenine DNA glycosylase AlkD|tara:strand:+ start:3154 stop:3351 length:198 start_codon:yes stop_codon:yes gene_type:complete
MNEIKIAAAVFSITRERRQAVVDSLIYGNVKSMEHYRELIGNLEALNHVDQELKDLLERQEQHDE